jgi:hypothetical protein
VRLYTQCEAYGLGRTCVRHSSRSLGRTGVAPGDAWADGSALSEFHRRYSPALGHLGDCNRIAERQKPAAELAMCGQPAPGVDAFIDSRQTAFSTVGDFVVPPFCVRVTSCSRNTSERPILASASPTSDCGTRVSCRSPRANGRLTVLGTSPPAGTAWAGYATHRSRVPGRPNKSLMPTPTCGVTLTARLSASAARVCGIAQGR